MSSGSLSSPEFVEGFPGGARFVLKITPPRSAPRRGVILCIQPFLDEATLARRVLVEQARQLAAEGWLTWIPDLFGTGDSAGDTVAATFDIWEDDLSRWSELIRRDHPAAPLVFWGTRMGALVAAHLSHTTRTPHHLLLWQMPASGRALIDPLRKLGRLANGKTSEPSANCVPQTLPLNDSAERARAEPLAGYLLDTRLLQGLADLTGAAPEGLQAPAPGKMLLLNTQRVVREGQSMSTALAQSAKQWQLGGWDVSAAQEQGEPYWSSMEPSMPAATFERTSGWLAALSTARAVSDQKEAKTVSTGQHHGPAMAAMAAMAPMAPMPPMPPMPPMAVSDSVRECAVIMKGQQGQMIGILALPATSALPGGSDQAVLIVAGQPQTRVGSHRMFVELARGLARRGIPTLRFDVGGWGDSPGQALAFEQSIQDIAAAAHTLRNEVERNAALQPRIWVGGLCDGASAAMLAIAAIERTGIAPAGVYLLNPWVRSEASLGDAMIRNYYAKRLMDPALWKRLFSGKLTLNNLIADPLRHLRAKFMGNAGRAITPSSQDGSIAPDNSPQIAAPLAQVAAPINIPAMLMRSREKFKGKVATILSGADLTAAETESLISRDPRWQRGLEGRSATILRIPDADHTLTRREHWDQAIDWLASQITCRK